MFSLSYFLQPTVFLQGGLIGRCVSTTVASEKGGLKRKPAIPCSPLFSLVSVTMSLVCLVTWFSENIYCWNLCLFFSGGAIWELWSSPSDWTQSQPSLGVQDPQVSITSFSWISVEVVNLLFPVWDSLTPHYGHGRLMADKLLLSQQDFLSPPSQNRH